MQASSLSIVVYELDSYAYVAHVHVRMELDACRCDQACQLKIICYALNDAHIYAQHLHR
jgi:hypothetical protein